MMSHELLGNGMPCLKSILKSAPFKISLSDLYRQQDWKGFLQHSVLQNKNIIKQKSTY